MKLEMSLPDVDGLIRKIAQEHPKIIIRTLREVGNQTRTQVKREITTRYALKSSDTKDQIKVSINPSKFEAAVSLRSKLLAVIQFNPRFARRTGTTIEIIRGSRKKVMRPNEGFIAQLQSGHVGVFQRTGVFATASKGRYIGKKRERIREVFTISASQMMIGKPVFDKIQNFFAEKAPEILRRNMDFYFSQIKGN